MSIPRTKYPPERPCTHAELTAGVKEVDGLSFKAKFFYHYAKENGLDIDVCMYGTPKAMRYGIRIDDGHAFNLTEERFQACLEDLYDATFDAVFAVLPGGKGLQVSGA